VDNKEGVPHGICYPVGNKSPRDIQLYLLGNMHVAGVVGNEVYTVRNAVYTVETYTVGNISIGYQCYIVGTPYMPWIHVIYRG